MKKMFLLILFIFVSSIISANYVFTNNRKHNMNKLVNSVWRDKLEKIEIKKVGGKWYIEEVFDADGVSEIQRHEIHFIENGIFYVLNPDYNNMEMYYGYNTKNDELWHIEECDEGWCLLDNAFQRFEK